MDTPTLGVQNRLSGPFALLSKAWQIFRQKLKPLVFLTLFPILFMFVLSLGIIPLSAAPKIIGILILIIMGCAAIFIQLSTQLALTYTVTDSTNTLKAWPAFKKAAKNFWPYIALAALSSLAIFGGFLLLLIPGFVVAVALLFTTYIFAVEEKKGLAALGQSVEYTKGYRWSIFWRFLFIFVAISVIFKIIEIIFGEASSLTNLLSGLFSLILVPLSLCYLFVMYQELKGFKAAAITSVTPPKWLKAFVILGLVALILFISFAPKLSQDALKIIEEGIEQNSLNKDDLSSELEQILGQYQENQP